MTGDLLSEDGPDLEAPPRVVRIAWRSLDALLAIALIVFVVLWRTWAVFQWTFQGDDWTYISRAMQTPFVHFVTTQYNGHLLAGQFVLVWLASRAAPLSYVVAMTPLLVLTLLAGFLMWRFLRALFGDRPGNLIPLAVFMLCPLSVPPALWWASALTIIPLQFFIVAVLFAVLRYVRDPSASRLAVVGLAYGGAVIFWQKAVLIVPVVVLFTLFFLGKGSGRTRISGLIKGRWQLWAVLGGITVPYVAWYLAAAKGEVTGHPTTLQVERLVTKSIGSTIIPTYLGGPWRASLLGKAFVFELGSPTRFLTWLVAALVVAVSLLLYRQAWRAWILLLTYVGMCVALVAFGRLPLIGAVSGLGSRYFADSVAVFAIALGLAFAVPLDRRTDAAWVRRVFVIGAVEREGRSDTDAQRRFRSSASSRPRLTSRKIAVGVVLLYAVSALLTSYRMAGLAHTGSAKGWFATVRSAIRSHPTASIFDGYLPLRAAPPSLEQARLSRALAPISPHVRWNTPDENMLIFDVAGHLRPLSVLAVTSVEPGPTPGCGYLVARVQTTVTVRLRQQLPSSLWGVRLGYYSQFGAVGFVTLDGDRQPVAFLPGLHPVTLIHYGTATSVTIEAVGNPLCIGYVWVGYLRTSISG